MAGSSPRPEVVPIGVNGRPMVGMLLHQDGSTHQWLPDQWWALIVTMDDANSKVYGVSTKYLQNYLRWFERIELVKVSPRVYLAAAIVERRIRFLN